MWVWTKYSNAVAILLHFYKQNTNVEEDDDACTWRRRRIFGGKLSIFRLFVHSWMCIQKCICAETMVVSGEWILKYEWHQENIRSSSNIESTEQKRNTKREQLFLLFFFFFLSAFALWWNSWSLLGNDAIRLLDEIVVAIPHVCCNWSQ